MKQVKIINGVYGHKPQGSKFVQSVRAGEAVTVTDEEAARLVSLNVAICIGPSAQEDRAAPVATPGEGLGDGSASETMTEGGRGAEGLENGNLPGGASTLDIVDGHFTVESLMEMTRANMEKLAADLGVDVSKCKNKSDVAVALAAVEVEPGEPEGDGETPPDLGVAPPVV